MKLWIYKQCCIATLSSADSFLGIQVQMKKKGWGLSLWLTRGNLLGPLMEYLKCHIYLNTVIDYMYSYLKWSNAQLFNIFWKMSALYIKYLRVIMIYKWKIKWRNKKKNLMCFFLIFRTNWIRIDFTTTTTSALCAAISFNVIAKV